MIAAEMTVMATPMGPPRPSARRNRSGTRRNPSGCWGFVRWAILGSNQ